MSGDGVSKAALVSGTILALGYIAAGVIGWLADVTDGDGSDLAFWLLLLLGGGLLILLGLFRFTSPPALAVALVAIGALAGALALVWSIVAPVLAVALIVLMLLRARRGQPTPA